MTTTEKLTKIRARCVKLLAIAEKRTLGEWSHRVRPNGQKTIEHGEHKDAIATIWSELNEDGNRDYQTWEANATFIASCAGSAEAGWRSTIAAVDGLLKINDHGGDYVSNEYDSGMETAFSITSCEASETITAILAAWPEELL